MLIGESAFTPCGCQDVSLSHLSLFLAQLVPLPEVAQEEEEEEEDKPAAGEEQGKGGGISKQENTLDLGPTCNHC